MIWFAVLVPWLPVSAHMELFYVYARTGVWIPYWFASTLSNSTHTNYRTLDPNLMKEHLIQTWWNPLKSTYPTLKIRIDFDDILKEEVMLVLSFPASAYAGWKFNIVYTRWSCCAETYCIEYVLSLIYVTGICESWVSFSYQSHHKVFKTNIIHIHVP